MKTAFIIGASKGIGLAIVRQLLLSTSDNIIATYRTSAEELKGLQDNNKDRLKIERLDLENESDYELIAKKFKSEKIKINLLINCAAFLHDKDDIPEKSLRSISKTQMIKSFTNNTIPTALLGKFFSRMLDSKSENRFIAISAKVGSIEDNAMGGWYGYRSSKAALNMILKNIDIELARMKTNTIVLAIHPGTTDTDLSKPFIKNTPYKLHSSDSTAKNILSVIMSKTIDDSGGFFSWDNKNIPW